MDDDIYFGMGIDLLDFRNTKLRDLMGYATLAHELIQNADDAANTASMSFDVRSDALVVDNDGSFSDCGRPEARTCLWKTPAEPKKKCDFHGFRNVASGHKQTEEKTTGNFGIGFTSVYQITDHPELISSGRHWIVDELQEEDRKKIRQCGGCDRCQNSALPNTRFILPWAMVASEMRERLAVDPLDRAAPDAVLKELLQSVRLAMLFLIRLRRISILRDGKLQVQFERYDDPNNNTVTITDGRSKEEWLIVRSDFEQLATKFRAEHANVEAKRSGKISLAIPQARLIQDGVFCACLPTEQPTGLPFHINADFFPKSDRKGIIVGSDFRAAWNNLAITAAAEAISSHLEWIRDRVSPQHLWNLIEAVVSVNSMSAHVHRLLDQFPDRLKKCIPQKKVVQTSLGQWVIPSDAVFPKEDEELESLPILEGLGLNVVHRDLRFAKKLLLGPIVGVKVLDSERLAEALLKSGLNRRTEATQLPDCLKRKGHVEMLWAEVARLRNREPDTAWRLFRPCAIAPARDGAFWPCKDVYQSHEETIASFNGILPTILYLDAKTAFAEVLAENKPYLCPWFTIMFAIDRLAELPADTIPKAIERNTFDSREILRWMNLNKKQIAEDKQRQQTLASMPIFPTKNGVKPLTELSLPGDFTDDPLGVANLVDLDVLDGDREFFRLLNATELTFENYVRQHVARELQNKSLDRAQESALVTFLAANLERVKTLDEKTRQILKAAQLVECTDGEFRSAGEVYFRTAEVSNLLGQDIAFAKADSNENNSIGVFNKWLGVATQPRAADVGNLIEAIKSKPPTASAVALIPLILEFQNRNPKAWNFETLKQWSWLPARGERERWFRPAELYSDEEGYLFESQVRFIDIPTATRNAVDAVLNSLGVNYKPTERLVVRHLLHCATQKKSLNRKVYDWLNEHTSSVEFDQLLGRPCILLPDGTYVRPNQVFWKSASFGRYRKQLPAEWRKHDPLYRRLGVRDEPVASDAITLLSEIAAEFPEPAKKLDEETRLVNLACWKMLESALANGQIKSADFSSLGKIKSVCTSDGLLQSPESLFFDDRTGLAAKFGGLPSNNVVGPSEVHGMWRAMEAAGMRRLSQLVEIHLVEVEDPIANVEIRRHLQSLKHPLARVIDVHKSKSTDSSGVKGALDLIDRLNYSEVRQLTIRYSIDADLGFWKSEPENTHAQFIAADKTLYFTLVVRKNRAPEPHWPAIARELATLLVPDGETGLLSGAINTVIDSESATKANEKLDELGIPDFGFQEKEAPVAASTVIEDFGDDESTAGQQSTETVAAPRGDTSVAASDKGLTKPTVSNDVQEAPHADTVSQVPPADNQKHPAEGNDKSTQRPHSATSTESSGETRDAESHGAGESHRQSRSAGGKGGRWSARQSDDESDRDAFEDNDENEDSAGDNSSTGCSTGRPRQERQRDGIRRGYSNLKSFVMPDRLEEDVVADPKGHATRNAVGNAGVARVLEFERQQGRIPQEMPVNHPGFDVKSRNKSGEVERYIEVKSFAGDWDGTAAGLTRKEFDRAVGLQDRYWLYIVERAQSANPRIYRIKNPAGKVDRFMFDDGWKKVAE